MGLITQCKSRHKLTVCSQNSLCDSLSVTACTTYSEHDCQEQITAARLVSEPELDMNTPANVHSLGLQQQEGSLRFSWRTKVTFRVLPFRLILIFMMFSVFRALAVRVKPKVLIMLLCTKTI